MAKRRRQVQVPVPAVIERYAGQLTMADLPRDDICRDELGKHVIRIREGQGFWSIPLTNWVKRRWPHLGAFHTGTDDKNSLIYIYWASLDETKRRFPCMRATAGST
jgi:hypothetical protein